MHMHSCMLTHIHAYIHIHTLLPAYIYDPVTGISIRLIKNKKSMDLLANSGW